MSFGMPLTFGFGERIARSAIGTASKSVSRILSRAAYRQHGKRPKNGMTTNWGCTGQRCRFGKSRAASSSVICLDSDTVRSLPPSGSPSQPKPDLVTRSRSSQQAGTACYFLPGAAPTGFGWIS
jgi:hypothetical protein